VNETNDWFDTKNSLSPLALADPLRRPDCAPAIARGLAAGVGGLLAGWDRLDRRHKLDLLRRGTSAFCDALW
jgi:hypothetical protein